MVGYDAGAYVLIFGTIAFLFLMFFVILAWVWRAGAKGPDGPDESSS